MIFEKQLIFLGIKDIRTKNGKNVSFATLFDRETYEKFEFFMKNDIDLPDLEFEDVINCKFDFTSYNNSNYMALIEVEKVG